MREDIIGGLKNAMERGESLDSAIRSFINAGYKEDEVREAGNSIAEKQIPFIEKKEEIKEYRMPLAHYSDEEKPSAPKKNSRGIKIVLTLSLILAILILLLASLLFYKETIINFINSYI